MWKGKKFLDNFLRKKKKIYSFFEIFRKNVEKVGEKKSEKE
jgi:hypothetical protein